MKKEQKNTKNKEEKMLLFQKRSMAFISVAVLIVLLIAVTVTWFVLSHETGVSGLSGQVSEWDFVVSSEPGGESINEDTNIFLNVNKYINVTEGVMAPGTMGDIVLYARTTSDVVVQCNIYLDKTKLTLITDDGTDYSDILKSHIYFYSDKKCTNQIDMDNPMMVDIDNTEEKEIHIYWKWPYEGDEILPKNMTDGNEIESFLKQYDDNDCLISRYRENIAGEIKLLATGVGKEPEMSNEEENETNSESNQRKAETISEPEQRNGETNSESDKTEDESITENETNETDTEK